MTVPFALLSILVLFGIVKNGIPQIGHRTACAPWDAIAAIREANRDRSNEAHFLGRPDLRTMRLALTLLLIMVIGCGESPTEPRLVVEEIAGCVGARRQKTPERHQ